MPVITERLSAALGGRYRIERHLGEGGMATVYGAYDIKHERRVALKVLKPELAAVLGADRFVHEIKTTANLQHPHIVPLFDSGTADGYLYYVMPFIEGESLRDKLNRDTQLSVEAAVQIARDVADALEYAHRHGVIHRDIKPENILLQDGRPVVADFGIALAVSAAAGGRMTETGLSLGTPHYMSPEQATAERDLTPRSDVYSLGSVLYEMLTGEPPHMGKSAQQIIMKIVTDRARPVTELRKSVPPHVAAAVEKSLETLAADRFESARAFSDALGNPSFATATMRGYPETAIGRAPSRHALAKRVGLAGSFVAIGAVVALGAMYASGNRATASAALPVHFTLAVPDTQRLGAVYVNAISPNGRYIAYRAAYPAGIGIFMRDLTGLDVRFVDGSRHSNTGIAVTFSPDSRWLAFDIGGDLLRAPVQGGQATLFVKDVGLADPVWLEGDVLIGSDTSGALVAQVAPNGARRTVVASSPGTRFRFPADAGSRAIVFCKNSGTGTDTLVIAGIDGGHVASLGLAARRPLAVIGGVLYFVGADDALQAVHVDVAQRRVVGASTLLIPGVAATAGAAAVSQAGTAVVVSATRDWRLVLADARGVETVLTQDARNYQNQRLSPDERRVAFQIADRGRTDVWVRDVVGGAMTRLTTEGTSNTMPEWSPDGRTLYFMSNRSGRREVWSQAADFTAPAEQITPSGRSPALPLTEFTLSPDGKHLMLRLVDPSSGADLYAMSVEGDRALRPFVRSSSAEITPSFSRDGKWVAYVSSESGDYEVYVQPFPGPGPRTQVSVGGGRVPMWSRTGRTLYYTRSSQYFAVDFRAGTTFEVGQPRLLFVGEYRGGTLAHAGFDVTRDGSFLVAKPTQAPAIEVLLNLPAMVRGMQE